MTIAVVFSTGSSMKGKTGVKVTPAKMPALANCFIAAKRHADRCGVDAADLLQRVEIAHAEIAFGDGLHRELMLRDNIQRLLGQSARRLLRRVRDTTTRSAACLTILGRWA